VCKELLAGEHAGLHFVEIMNCECGCMNGPGQPRNKEAVPVRHKVIMARDADARVRLSHENDAIKKLYQVRPYRPPLRPYRPPLRPYRPPLRPYRPPVRPYRPPVRP
jgi:iron only hydrogenase large subunit-like protein